jgi:methionyl-tRNA formyltransferase
MMGTGPFAVPTFAGLYQSGHEIVALVTQPVEPGPAGPMRDTAHEHRTPIFDPKEVNGEPSRAHLRALEADLLVVCDYGQILSAETLATARLGGINVHGSLLPKYRGAAPINWAIYHGETETGVSIIHMTPRIDAGPLVAQGRTSIGPDETAVELEGRLAEIGCWLARRAIDEIAAGHLEEIPQDASQASKAPRLKKTDGLIDWARPAAAIKNQVRALEPWPKTYTFWRRPTGPPLRLIVGPVAALTEPSGAANLAAGPAPGTVVEAAGDRLVVAAGQGAILLATLQPAGKRMLSVSEFLRGYRVRPGETFGSI